MATQSDGRTVQLKNVRLSFTDSLKEKRATVADGKPKHSCNIILESGRAEFEANNTKVIAAIEEACDQTWGRPEEYKSIAEDNPKRVCYRKGERFKNSDGEVYQGYEGNMALTCSGPMGGDKRPKIIDRYKREVAVDDILDVAYGGVYADVFVSFFGTDKGGKGIFCSVDAIRSRQEGERIGGGAVNVDVDDFDDLPEGDDNPFA